MMFGRKEAVVMDVVCWGVMAVCGSGEDGRDR